MRAGLLGDYLFHYIHDESIFLIIFIFRNDKSHLHNKIMYIYIYNEIMLLKILCCYYYYFYK